MTEKQKNDVLYVCSLIETIARKTKNHRQDVIRHFTKADIERQLRLAEVNHCLSFEQVSDELIEDLNIPDGDFDTAAECRYTVPSATSIGMLYQGLVLSTMKDDDAAQAILDVFRRLSRMRSPISIPTYTTPILIISAAPIWRARCLLDFHFLTARSIVNE